MQAKGEKMPTRRRAASVERRPPFKLKPTNEVVDKLKSLIPPLKDDFVEWKAALVNVSVMEEWGESVLDLSFDHDEWDGVEEWNPVAKQQRMVAYQLMRLRLPEQLKYLASDGEVKMGDSRGLYKRIYDRFMYCTVGSLSAFDKKTRSMTMESEGVTLEKFQALLQQRVQLLRSKGKVVTEEEQVGILLDGLLPEFKDVATPLKLKDAAKLNYLKCFQKVLAFATDHGLTDLKRGKTTTQVKGKKYSEEEVQQLFKVWAKNKQSNKKESNNNNNSKKEKKRCRHYDKTRSCPYGDKCKFAHVDEGEKKQEKKFTGKGVCWNCGEKDA